MFDVEHSLKILQFIEKTQKIKFTLAEIKELIDISVNQNTCDYVIDILHKKICDTKNQKEEIEQSLLFLEDMHQKCLSTPKCSPNQKESICSIVECID